MTEEEDE